MYTDYTILVQEIREAFLLMIQESEYRDKKAAGVQVTSTTEQSVEIWALMSAADSPTAWNLCCEMREKLICYLQQHYPQNLPKTRVEINPKPDVMSENANKPAS